MNKQKKQKNKTLGFVLQWKAHNAFAKPASTYCQSTWGDEQRCHCACGQPKPQATALWEYPQDGGEGRWVEGRWTAEVISSLLQEGSLQQGGKKRDTFAVLLTGIRSLCSYSVQIARAVAA